MNELLQAPCIFCGYSGEGYWQIKTHDSHCPWYSMGGEVERAVVFKEKIVQLAKAHRHYAEKFYAGKIEEAKKEGYALGTRDTLKVAVPEAEKQGYGKGFDDGCVFNVYEAKRQERERIINMFTVVGGYVSGDKKYIRLEMDLSEWQALKE